MFLPFGGATRPRRFGGTRDTRFNLKTGLINLQLHWDFLSISDKMNGSAFF